MLVHRTVRTAHVFIWYVIGVTLRLHGPHWTGERDIEAKDNRGITALH
jgi:hypothetical protein